MKNRYGFRDEKKVVSFETKTEIEPVTIKAMNSGLSDVVFSSYEELKYYLKTCNPMLLRHAANQINERWSVDGLGHSLKLYSKFGEASSVADKHEVKVEIVEEPVVNPQQNFYYVPQI